VAKVKPMIPILDEEAVRSLLRMEALIPAMAEALSDLSAGRVVQPVRLVLPVADRGFFAAMPAYTGGALGAKLVTFFAGNVGVPTHHAIILLLDPNTGAPLAMVDGRLITEMRTAAVSAVATRYLARSDTRVLAILGSGVQAGSHLEALRLVRDFDEVRVWSPRNAAAFAERHQIRAMASVPDAVRGADVVVVATSARTPVLRGQWLSPGTHVNAVGACRPDWRELDDELARGARLYVESREAATRESGDVMAGTVVAEIGELVAGTAPGRQTGDEITLFKSVGVAAEDMAAAGLVYRLAGLPTPT
jgi:ornithine cyclodeaminase/alanine dehydrogenase-like protein (mu-crystallin family)